MVANFCMVPLLDQSAAVIISSTVTPDKGACVEEAVWPVKTVTSTPAFRSYH